MLGLTRGPEVGVRGAKFLRVGHARRCTGGPSASGARTVLGVDMAKKKKLGMGVGGSGEAEHSRRGRGSGQRVYPNSAV